MKYIVRTSRTLTVENGEKWFTECTHKGCNPCLSISRTEILIRRLSLNRSRSLHSTSHTVEQIHSEIHTHTHSQTDTDIHKILVIMDSSFFSFSVRSQICTIAHRLCCYFFFRSTFFPSACIGSFCLLQTKLIVLLRRLHLLCSATVLDNFSTSKA